MKNVFIEFLGKNGAGVTFTLEISKAFEQNGFRVFVLLSDQILNRPLWEQVHASDKNIDVTFIATGNKNNFILSTSKFLIQRKKILKPFENKEFYLALRTFPHPWMEFVEKSLNINKTLYILHDPVPHSGTGIIRKITAKRNAKTADDIIVLSKKFVEPVSQKYGIPLHNVHYMKHGILPVYETGDDATDLDFLKTENEDINFLFFGRIDKYKGLHILNKAYSALSSQYANTRLVIAGSGDFQEYRQEYETLKRCIVINRYIKDAEIRVLFSMKNTVVVLPYLDATQSGVITVAAEFLCPIIASDTGALQEQLDNGNLGRFFEKGNWKQLMKLMEDFIIHQELFHEEKEKMKRFRESLNWNLILQKLIKELE